VYEVCADWLAGIAGLDGKMNKISFLEIVSMIECKLVHER